MYPVDTWLERLEEDEEWWLLPLWWLPWWLLDLEDEEDRSDLEFVVTPLEEVLDEFEDLTSFWVSAEADPEWLDPPVEEDRWWWSEEEEPDPRWDEEEE